MASENLQIIIQLEAAAATQRLKGIEQALRKLGNTGKSTSKQTGKVRQSLDQTGKAAKRGRNSLGQFTKELKRTDATMKSTRSTAQLLRRALVAIGGFLILRKAIKTVADFGQAMSTVQAITKATGEEFATLEQRAKDLGATTRFTATQAAEGMVELARAGLDTNAVFETIDDTLTLAQAGAIELADASKLVATTMAAFRKSGLQAGHAVDVLATAANTSNTDVTQLGEALKHAGSTSALFGLDLEQTTAALQVLANNARAGSIGGSGLARVIARLAGVAEKVGVPLEKVDLTVVSLSEAIGNLAAAGVDAQEAMNLFGLRAGPTFNILAQNLPEVDKFASRLRGVEGSAKLTAEIMDNNLNGALLRVKSAFESLTLNTLDADSAGGELTKTMNILAMAVRGLGEEGSAFGNNMASAIRGVTYGVAYLTDSWRGLQMVWELLSSTWYGFAELVTKGLRHLQSLIADFRAAVLYINVAWHNVSKAFRIAARDIIATLANLVQKTRLALDAVNQFSDAAVPDALLKGLYNTERALARVGDAGVRAADQRIKSTKAEIEAQRILSDVLATDRSDQEQYWAAQRDAAQARLRELASEISNVDQLSLKYEELSRAIIAQKEKAQEAERKRLAAEDEGVKKTTPDGATAAAPGLSSETQLKAVQQKQKLQAMLSDIAVAGAQDEQSRLLALDEQATAEADLRFQERMAQAQVLFDQGMVSKLEQNDIEKQIVQAHENELAEIRKAANERVWDATSSTLQNASDAFTELYEASGKKAKEFFYAQKAIAIAMTLMKTYESAQNAYTTAAAIPYVGTYLAPVMAALAVAQGLARVNTIRQQSLAEGGEVQGFSPHAKADNINARLTAGEFVQPVSTVKYYGAQAMEAIRSRSIPREVLASAAAGVPPAPPSNRFRFQAGGAVARGARDLPDTSQGGRGSTPINIVNVKDPQAMSGYLQSKPGEKDVLNILTENQFMLKQIVLGED